MIYLFIRTVSHGAYMPHVMTAKTSIIRYSPRNPNPEPLNASLLLLITWCLVSHFWIIAITHGYASPHVTASNNPPDRLYPTYAILPPSKWDTFIIQIQSLWITFEKKGRTSPILLWLISIVDNWIMTPPIIIFVFLLLTRFFSHFHFFIEIASKSMSFPLAMNHGYTDV